MAKQRKKLLIVDGYNVLRSGRRYRSITDPDYTDDAFNVAREALINDVVGFAGNVYNAIIVFDGAKNEFSTGEVESIGGIKIMFSPAGQSADKVIEKLAYDARGRNIETLVVTSDGEIQDTVFGGGVDRMSSNDFSWEMNSLVEDMHEDDTHAGSKKNKLSDRLDDETRRKLEQLRDASKKKS